MRTPMQEHIERLKKEQESGLWSNDEFHLISECIDHAEAMLEKEKEVMIDFAYKFGDEPLVEIAKWYDKQFNTKRNENTNAKTY